MGNMQGALIYQKLREIYEMGSRNGAFPSEGAQCGGPVGRALLLGTLEDMLRKALDQGISLHRGPIGELVWGFAGRDF